MTNKRVHPNWWYAKRDVCSFTERYYLWKCGTWQFFASWLTEECLKDFWFEPVPDVYDECADEIVCSRWWTLDEFNEAKEILKKHFSKYVDIND